MLFNSYSFLLIFLPICLLGYWWLRGGENARASIVWLVGCSLLFYAWWNPIYLTLLLGSIAFNYGCSLALGKSQNRTISKCILGVGIVMNLCVLGYFKYALLAVDSWNWLSGGEHDIGTILLPIGISFFTFQQIAFLFDSFKERTKAPRLVDYCLFVAFFPQLIAGPIVHHKQMMPQFSKTGTGGLRLNHLTIGVSIFAIGLFKKVMIADEMAMHASPIFDAANSGVAPTFLESWIAALSYTMQLYFDFSGYSDMAIGLGRMFGIKLPVNFDSPYKSLSIVDFWRRWHITLSVFLKDYLYIPLGGNKYGSLNRYRNLMITMLLGGLWHGAAWTFLVWGGLHGLYLMINHAFRHSVAKTRLESAIGPTAFCVFCWTTTFLAVVFAWVLFRAESWGAANLMIQSMVGLNGFEFASSVSRLHAMIWLPTLLAFVVVLPNTQELMSRFRPAFGIRHGYRNDRFLSWMRWRPNISSAVVVGTLLLVSVMNLSRISEFVYYQF